MSEGIAQEKVAGGIYEVDLDDDGSPCGFTDTYFEFEYACPWSSGPMIFTSLKNMRTGEVLFPWSDEEIDAYI